MNISLHQPFSVSETSTGVRNMDIIYPDTQAVSAENRLFITCGESSNLALIAGQIVCEAIESYFHSFLTKGEDITPEFIEKSIRFAEISLDNYRKINPEVRGMGATLAMLFFAPECIYFSQIGKSHIYQLRGNRIVYKSIDASESRKIKGIKEPVEINIVRLKDIQPDDQFFIYAGDLACLHDEELICNILSKRISTEEKLTEIKRNYLNSSPCFSAHLIPIRDVIDAGSALRKRLSSLVHSFI